MNTRFSLDLIRIGLVKDITQKNPLLLSIMDGLIKLFWPLSNLNGPAMTIPTYRQGEQEDQIDLQIKSLMYMFKRCGIANSNSFADFLDSDLKTNPGSLSKLKSSGNLRNQYNFEQSIQLSGGMSLIDRQKLDIMYNKSQFEWLLAHDEHRVLIDWVKNKFRSLCILSDYPKELARLPTFGEYSHKYCFVVLPADSPDSEYVDVLVNSHLYAEHPLRMDTKKRLASSALTLARSTFRTRSINKDARAFVIKQYLHSLAIEVQVERLYRGSIRARMIDTKENNTRIDEKEDRSRSSSLTARAHSPTNPRPSSPARSPERTKFYMQNNSTLALRGRPDQKQLLAPAASISRVGTDRDLSQSPLNISMTTRSARSRNTSPPSPVRTLNIGFPPSPTSTTSSSSPRPMLKSKGSMPALSLSFSSIPNWSPKTQQGRTQHVKGDGLLTAELKQKILAQSRLAVMARLEREKSLLRNV